MSNRYPLNGQEEPEKFTITPDGDWEGKKGKKKTAEDYED